MKIIFSGRNLYKTYIDTHISGAGYKIQLSNDGDEVDINLDRPEAEELRNKLTEVLKDGE